MAKMPSGRVAYEAYATAKEWKDATNVQMPAWADMTKEERACWNETADQLLTAWLQAGDNTYPGVPTTLRPHHTVGVSRTEDQPVLAQVGWRGATGIVYGIDDEPIGNERGSYSPLYVQVGTWVVAEPAKYMIAE